MNDNTTLKDEQEKPLLRFNLMVKRSESSYTVSSVHAGFVGFCEFKGTTRLWSSAQLRVNQGAVVGCAKANRRSLYLLTLATG